MTTANHHLGFVLRHIHGMQGRPALDRLADDQILERFALRREEGAFTELVARHGPMVRGVCRRLLQDERTRPRMLFRRRSWC